MKIRISLEYEWLFSKGLNSPLFGLLMFSHVGEKDASAVVPKTKRYRQIIVSDKIPSILFGLNHGWLCINHWINKYIYETNQLNLVCNASLMKILRMATFQFPMWRVVFFPCAGNFVHFDDSRKTRLRKFDVWFQIGIKVRKRPSMSPKVISDCSLVLEASFEVFFVHLVKRIHVWKASKSGTVFCDFIALVL